MPGSNEPHRHYTATVTLKAIDILPLTPGTRLRHYKGGLYEVVGACLIEATLQPGVLYKPLQGDMQDVTWMRPLAEFTDTVHTPEGPRPRFAIVPAATR
jgi:hypothetical protein